MGHPVTWFQIQGKDGKTLSSFYKKAFNWKMSPSPGPEGLMMVTPDKPGGIAGGVGNSTNGQSSVTVYIECDDIDKHLAQIEKLGGRTVMSKMALPSNMGFIAGFVDPASNWIGLWQPATKKPARKSTKRAAAKKATKKAKAKPKKR